MEHCPPVSHSQIFLHLYPTWVWSCPQGLLSTLIPAVSKQQHAEMVSCDQLHPLPISEMLAGTLEILPIPQQTWLVTT